MHVARNPAASPHAFGSCRRHLDIRFADQARPAVVTEVLAACLTDGHEPEMLWGWTIGRRLQALLAVALAGGEQGASHLARCANPACRQTMELELDLRDFVRDTDERPFDWSPDDGGARLGIRLPTGDDQRRWGRQQDSGPLAAATLATDLVQSVDGRKRPPDWRLPQPWLAGLAAELDRRDPLTALEISASCPACAMETEVEFDLEAFLLQGLARRQQTLLEEVHRLAAAYHWSESEILAIPAWRRDLYRKRIDAEVD